MNRQPNRFLLAATVLSCWASRIDAQQFQVYFSPNGGAAAAVAKEIDAAKTSIHIIAFSISEDQITAALLAAHKRGVDVNLIVNPNQQNDLYTTADKLKKAGIPTLVDRAHALQHNKTAVIDNATVITGSMNWTESGNTKNAENTIIIRDAAVAAIYAANWTLHHEHSETYRVIHAHDYRPKATPPEFQLPQPRPRTKEP